jgi:hypothetical protein
MVITTEKLMYFTEKDFSPRYGSKFFTMRFLPIDHKDHGVKVRSNNVAGSNADDDAVPPGSTSMLDWVADILGFGEGCCTGNGSSGPYLEYSIEIRRGKQVWVAKKRYSDFAKFLQDISDSLPPESKQFESFEHFPKNPSFTLFNDFSDEFIEKRHRALSKFMDEILRELTHRNLIDMNNIVYDFTVMRTHGKGEGG